MPQLMLPGDTGLLLPTKLLPKLEMGSGTKGSTTTTAAGAGLASDYTWSMIFVTMACAVMVVVSAMKGVRRFSFALTYTNLWYMFGKRGRLRLRVHSFTSTNGSNCFVTTSGEFSAELVKEEEELEKQLDSDFDQKPNAVKGPGAGRAGCIVGTEMVFIYNDRTSVFTAGSLARFPPRKSYREALCTPVGAQVSGRKLESLSRLARAERVAGQLPNWQLGAIRARKNRSDEMLCSRMDLVPDWALELLEPLEIGTCQSSPFALVQRSFGSSDVKSDYQWDAALRMRLAGAEEGRRPHASTNEEIVYPAAVVAGAAHTATLRNNVVKLWDNSTRRSVGTMPVSTASSIVASFDLDWEEEFGAFGSWSGELSVWDLERAKCVTALRAHEGSISCVRLNAGDELEEDGWVLTAGRSADQSESCVSLWDARVFCAAAATRKASGLSSVDDMKFRDYEVVARDENSRISMYDIRMLNSTPVFVVGADEVRSVECKGVSQVGQFVGQEEEWWDVNGGGESFDEDGDFGDDWGTVDEELVKSPSVLSRCFNALSSAISR